MAQDTATVICTYAGDDAGLLRRCLEATVQQAPVVLVDMSQDGRMAALGAELADVEAVHAPQSRGLGDSRALGLARCDARFVAFLDSDAIPRHGWMPALRSAVAPEDVAVAGGPVLPVWPSGTRRPGLFTTTPAQDFLSMLDLGPAPLDVPRVLPGNMIVDRDVVGEDVFDRELGRADGGLVSAEEIRMMTEVVARGRRIVYAPAAAIDHHTSEARMSWRWMWRRVYAAGQESRLTDERLAPIPRKTTARDRAFLLVVAPAYIAGRFAR